MRLLSEKISAHKSVVEMYGKIKEGGITNIWDRWEAQERVRCKNYCARGLSCQFCSNGPCRIIPNVLERGTCGMTGDGMAIRYMLLRNAMGLSTYTYHAREVAKTLIATGEGRLHSASRMRRSFGDFQKGLALMRQSPLAI